MGDLIKLLSMILAAASMVLANPRPGLPSADAAEAAPPAAPMRWLDTELFSVEVPAAWTQLDEAALESKREQAESIVREIFPPEVSSTAPLDRVHWMTAFAPEDESSLLLLLISEIPPPEDAGRPYIERKLVGYADWQRSQELIETVKVSDLEELNGMPAVEMTLGMPGGATLYTVHVWTSVYRDRVGSVVAVARPDVLAQAREMLLGLLSRIKPSPAVAAEPPPAGFRDWLRDKVWEFQGATPTEALAKRIVIVLITFTVCFALSLRLLYEAILVWYRWHNMEDRVLEAARRAARDVLRVGYFYSERMTMTCALFSMTVTTAALAWLAVP